jgi:membrane protein
MKPGDFIPLFKEAFQKWRADGTTWYAAALAFYVIFSLSPLMVIAIAVAGAVFGEQAARGEIVEQITSLVGFEGAAVIENAIDNAHSETRNTLIASFVGAVMLLWGASKVFAQLQAALNLIWDLEKNPEAGLWNFIRKRFLSFGMVLGVGFLLMVSLLINAFLSGLTNFMGNFTPGLHLLWNILNNVLSLGVLTLLFAMIYKFLPDAKLTWKNVWVGALMTALLFTVGKFAIGLYLGRSSIGSVYGAAGSLVVLLIWVYFSALIFFFGAEFIRVYTRRTCGPIEPEPLAVKIPQRQRRFRF